MDHSQPLNTSQHIQQLSHVLNVLHPGTRKGNAYAIAHLLPTHAQVLPMRISCLTRSLRCLTRTAVLLTPHPYKGPAQLLNTRVQKVQLEFVFQELQITDNYRYTHPLQILHSPAALHLAKTEVRRATAAPAPSRAVLATTPAKASGVSMAKEFPNTSAGLKYPEFIDN